MTGRGINTKWSVAMSFVCIALILFSCRKEEVYLEPSDVRVSGGFFLLNEGNMGSNKASIDYFDFDTQIYTRNVFARRNPDVVLELGDGGNDIAVYGSRLYAVINRSNLIEVADASTVRHIGQISVANCRNITFCEGYAYVSSYAGAAYGDDGRRKGFVAKIDTLTLEVVDTCEVGYQPEEMVVYGSKLYVANSGGYCAPDYDRTVSVIDLTTFSVSRTIDVDVNLHRMEVDRRRGQIYVSSRGDYGEVSSGIYVIDALIDEVVQKLPGLRCADMTLAGDMLYVVSTEWNNETYTTDISYSAYDVVNERIVTDCFITDGTAADIVYPYGIAVNPVDGAVFIADAGDFMTPGTLHCYNRDGHRLWSVMTGDLPGHFAFF